MKFVLLAGGKGTRLWPASSDVIPKQFLKIYENDTMIEKTFKNLCSSYDSKDIYIATNKEYKCYLKKLFHDFDNYIIEPKSNGTYSAILNISAYLKYKKNISNDEEICILPIDSNVDKDFFNIFKEVEKKHKDRTSICLIGIKPNSISSQYGYIVHDNNKVLEFKEKPNLNETISLINNGALWNSGIIIASLDKLMSFVYKYDVKNYKEFINKYLDIPRGSFDVNILEKEKNLIVISSNCKWCDIGVWENLSPLISKTDQYNTNIINYENKKIVNDGVMDAIIVNSSNGIKLLSKNKDDKVIRKWGYFEVLNYFKGMNIQIKIKKLNLLANKNISYQFHRHRNEDWIILSGDGVIILNGDIKKVKNGDKVSIKVGEKHSIKANTFLEIIEIQYGELCTEEDVVRLEEDWELMINKYVKEVKE